MNFTDFGLDTASLAGALEAKLAAIDGAGFPQVMLSAADVVGHPAGTGAGIRAVRASGLRVTGFEALRDFEGLAGKLHEYKVDVAKSMLEVCHRLGGRLLLVEASTSAHADADPQILARHLRKLAVLAIPLAIRIAYKPLSWSRTASTLDAAAELVFEADCPNLGLAIDTFDLLATETPPEALDALDPDQIFLVQLADYMWQSARPEDERGAATTQFRVFPGEGAHSDRLATMVTQLHRMGYVGDYSFDVYNQDYLQMPPETVAERGRRAAEWLGETVLRRALPVPNMERLLRGSVR